MKSSFIAVETAIKIKLSSVWEQLNQRHNQREQVIDFEDDEFLNETAQEKELSTQFLQMQKNPLIDLQEHFERYCKTLPIFGFNSAKFHINLIKSYLLPILVNEQQIEPAVFKKSNKFVSFKFGDVQLLDIMNILGGATSLDRSSKITKQRRLKAFSLMSGSTISKGWTTKLPPYVSFFSKLRNINLLKNDYSDFEYFTVNGLSSERAVCKLRLNKILSTADKNYAFLLSIWVSEGMKPFKDFLMWKNNKDVVPTQEAMQKMIEFYHQKRDWYVKLGLYCT